jgi:predicted Zn-dependent peptidase
MMLVWATGYPGGDLAALEAAMSEELLALTGAEPPELERAIMLAETDLVHALERMAGRADLLSMFELYFGDPDRLNRELDRLSAISVEQIRTFATERLGADNRAVLTYEPTDAVRSGSAA